MEKSDQNQMCPICGSKILKAYATDRDIYSYFCPVCGNVNITDRAVAILVQELRGLNHVLSGFTRERAELGLKPIDIHSHNIKDLVRGANIPKNVSEKLDRVLLYLEGKSEHPGKEVLLVSGWDYSVAYAKNSEELRYLLNQIVSLGWIKDRGAPIPPGGIILAGSRVDECLFVITVDGWNRLAELHRYQRISDQAFVAMWFTSETERAYKEGIEKALNESGFRPLRVDKLEHNNKICDLIIAEIRKSAFLVADFTGHRGGVYFEAGFALGLGIPVIWLCRQDQVNDLHFDTRQYNHIVWENEADLYQKLLNRINATIIR